MERQLFPGAALGYRLFRVREDGLLGSVVQEDAWAPGANRARCLFSSHKPPHPACKCGLYALYSLDAVAALDANFIVAAVAGWGDAELHADGWRCEYARVVALLAPRLRGRRRARRIARLYGVPAFTSRKRLRAYAERVARPPAPELRPRRSGPQLIYAMGSPPALRSVGLFLLALALLLSPFLTVAGFAAYLAWGAEPGLRLALAGALFWALAAVIVLTSIALLGRGEG